MSTPFSTAAAPLWVSGELLYQLEAPSVHPGPALGYALSQPWPIYIQRDAHEGLASLPDAKQPQLVPLNAETQQLNPEALWTVWLLSVSWILSLVSMWINLNLAA